MKPKTKMYPERKTNISAFRGCGWGCTYCAFKNTLRFQSCDACKKFNPHAHLEALNKTPPKTNNGEYVAVGMNGDVAFASVGELRAMINYCTKWSDRTFMMQSKDPSCFIPYTLPDNLIIATTIESDIDHDVSKAPNTVNRFESMRSLNCRKMITIEPILTFNMNRLFMMIHLINPEIVYIGYDSKNNNLPEPTIDETRELIEQLRISGIDVKEKLIRKAWYE